MKGHDDIIEVLNDVLTAELTAINQYFVDAKMAANWGYQRLAAHFREESIDEMRDAEALIERILYLDGLPNLQRLSPVRIGETIPEKLELALDLERVAIDRLNKGIARCTEIADHGTRQLLDKILHGEEDHADWIEAQLEAINQIGAPNWLAQHLHSES